MSCMCPVCVRAQDLARGPSDSDSDSDSLEPVCKRTRVGGGPAGGGGASAGPAFPKGQENEPPNQQHEHADDNKLAKAILKEKDPAALLSLSGVKVRRSDTPLADKNLKTAKKARNMLAKRLHPDKSKADKELATKATKAVNNAWERVSGKAAQEVDVEDEADDSDDSDYLTNETEESEGEEEPSGESLGSTDSKEDEEDQEDEEDEKDEEEVTELGKLVRQIPKSKGGHIILNGTTVAVMAEIVKLMLPNVKVATEPLILYMCDPETNVWFSDDLQCQTLLAKVEQSLPEREDVKELDDDDQRHLLALYRTYKLDSDYKKLKNSLTIDPALQDHSFASKLNRTLGKGMLPFRDGVVVLNGDNYYQRAITSTDYVTKTLTRGIPDDMRLQWDDTAKLTKLTELLRKNFGDEASYKQFLQRVAWMLLHGKPNDRKFWIEMYGVPNAGKTMLLEALKQAFPGLVDSAKCSFVDARHRKSAQAADEVLWKMQGMRLVYFEEPEPGYARGFLQLTLSRAQLRLPFFFA